MRINHFFTAFVALGVLFVSSAQAAVVTVTPNASSVELGDQISIDLVVSDLGDGVAPSLGVFDIDFVFDSSVLALSSVTYGDQLDLFGLGSLQSTDNSVSGLVNLFELSFDLADDLDTLQAPSFTLATLVFDTLSIASASALSIAINAFGDSVGDALAATVVNASVDITAPPATEIPLPAAFVFMLSGLGFLRIKKGF